MQPSMLLFVVYLFGMALIPCQDEQPVIAFDAPVELHEANAEHDHNDAGHQDHCTPFCVCACCSAVADAPPTLYQVAEEQQPLPPRGITQPSFVRDWNPTDLGGPNGHPPRV